MQLRLVVILIAAGLAGCASPIGRPPDDPAFQGLAIPRMNPPTLDGVAYDDEWFGTLAMRDTFRIPGDSVGSGDFPFEIRLGGDQDYLFAMVRAEGLGPNPFQNPHDPGVEKPDSMIIYLTNAAGDLDAAGDSFVINYYGEVGMTFTEGYWDPAYDRWYVQDERATIMTPDGQEEGASRGRALHDPNGTTYEFRIHRSAKVAPWDALDLSGPLGARLQVKLVRQQYRPGEETGNASVADFDRYSDTWPGIVEDDPSTWLRIQLN